MEPGGRDRAGVGKVLTHGVWRHAEKNASPTAGGCQRFTCAVPTESFHDPELPPAFELVEPDELAGLPLAAPDESDPLEVAASLFAEAPPPLDFSDELPVDAPVSCFAAF